MLSNSSFASECPKCGKLSLVRHQDGVYRCVACDFKRDFNQPESESSGAALFFAIILFITLIVTVMQHEVTNSCAPNDLQCIERERLNR